MPNSVLTRGRKFVARLTALAMVASIMVIGAAPASAAIDTSATCPSSTPSAGFVDIAAYSASTQLAINCLVDYGISQGTSATTYSPQAEVSRWQMALFLTRQASVHGLTLGDGSDQGFTDIGAYPAATQTAINQLAQLEITTGTTATTYSPAAPVSRWQMALFLTRLLDAAGYTLGSGADQGFTDIAAYPASTQTAINQIAQADVSEGFTATTFGPGSNTLRSQMALFLTRTLAADGITPTGTYFWVTAISVSNNRLTYSDGTTTQTYTWVDADAKTRNGAAVSNAVYEATITGWSGTATAGATDGVVALRIDPVSGDVMTGDATSGLIGAVAATEFHIVEPVTGVAIGEVYHGNASSDYDFFQVDGASATEAGYNANVSVGDTGTLTADAGDDGTTAAKARTISITNGTVSGEVTADGTGNFTVGVLVITDPVDGDTKSVDGTSVALASDWLAELTVGDTATYAKAGGVSTYTLTNGAPAPIEGKVLDFNITNDTISVSVNGTATAVTYTGSSFINDGVVDTEDGLEGDLSIGDTVSYQAPDTNSSTTESLRLTNATLSGTPAAARSGNTLTLKFTATGAATIAIDYTSTSPAQTDLTGTAVKYTVNGNASASEANFESAYDAVISGFVSGTVTLTKSGNDLIWTITTA